MKPKKTLSQILDKYAALMLRQILDGYQEHPDKIFAAAKNEIIRLRLQDLTAGYREGYDAGFECAEVAARSIVTAQKRFDEIDNPAGGAASPSTAGEVHPIFGAIIDGLKFTNKI